ncbi:MAG: 6-carboxytetrahydropterin synthase [Candidatus Omnitrophota bacterium]
MGYLIRIEKQNIKFSSAHFTLFTDGREALHGHNYVAAVEAEADQLQGGFLIDFSVLKTTLKSICSALDEKVLLPENPRIVYRLENHVLRFQVDEADEYAMPAEETVRLPLENITCESLAGYVHHLLCERREQWDPEKRVRRLRIWIEETPGQRGGYEDALEWLGLNHENAKDKENHEKGKR